MKERQKLTCGEKISSLRKKNNVTQAELGAALNVSYQAVSKWERGESYPDFETMSRIAKYFSVPLSYFEEGGKIEAAAASSAEKPELPQPMGVCHECNRTVYEGGGKIVPTGRTRSLVCNECIARGEEEKRAQKARERENVRRRMKAGLIVGAIVAVVALVFGIVSANEGTFLNFVYGVLGMIFSFTFVSQLFWGGAVVDCCLWGGKIVGTPGVIFDLSWDGLKFLILCKLIFLAFRICIWLLTFVIGIFLGILISPFTFIPALIRVKSGDI